MVGSFCVLNPMTQSINKMVSEAKTKKEKTMNNKLFTKNAVRHGEVLITPIDDLPENLEQIFEGKEYRYHPKMDNSQMYLLMADFAAAHCAGCGG